MEPEGTSSRADLPPQVQQAEAELRRCVDPDRGWDKACEAAADRFALAMVEADTDDGDMARRLCERGISRRKAWKLVARAHTRRLEREAEKEAGQIEQARPVCPHCQANVDALTHFCPECGGPITVHASMDPLGQVFSMGRGYRQAISGTPSWFVVVGMWLIFGPLLGSLLLNVYLFLRYVLLDTGHSGQGWEDLLAKLLPLALFAGVLLLYTAILWKVTARYLCSRDDAGDGESTAMESEI